MIKLNDMTQYWLWLSNEGEKLERNEFKIVYVESLKKYFCVCGSPITIETIGERAGLTFAKEWNEAANTYGEEDFKVSEDDIDLISTIKDVSLKALSDYFDMEFVLISEEC